MTRTASAKGARPSAAQRSYLARGLSQPGGKLPLFDEGGQRYSERTIRTCVEKGWAEPWFANPIKPDWTVCKLTEAGRTAMEADQKTASKPPRRLRQKERIHLQLVE